MKVITDFLTRNGIFDIPKNQQLIAVVKLVAEIPWGEGRTIDEVLITRGFGTCQGKHLVLQTCFEKLEIEYRPVVCTFRWKDQSIKYPENVRKILAEGPWDHGHNFVQISANGNLIDVDVTYNSKLKPYGFKTFPQNWDGKTSFVGVDNIVKRWDGAEMLAMKKDLIESTDPKLRERRERFLKVFIPWVESINKQIFEPLD